MEQRFLWLHTGGDGGGGGSGGDGPERQERREEEERQATIMNATICFGEVHHTENRFNKCHLCD